jgi:hypothetical protein
MIALRLRTPSGAEFGVQALVALTMVTLIWDYASALLAVPCAVEISSRCYPWGNEGPAGEFWNYRTKSIYLQSSVVTTFAVAVGVFAPFVARGRRSGLAATLFFPVSGFLGVQWLGEFWWPGVGVLPL